MSDTARLFLLIALGLLSALPIYPRLALAQSGSDSTWVALDVTAALNSAIEKSPDSAELREKIVRRFSECSLVYGGLSTLTSNPQSKKNYIEAQTATMEVEATIAKPLERQRRLELEEAARQSVAIILRNMGLHGDKEVGPLVRHCKAINDLKEIKNALRELSSQ
jgi:hypothetical protein